MIDDVEIAEFAERLEQDELVKLRDAVIHLEQENEHLRNLLAEQAEQKAFQLLDELLKQIKTVRFWLGCDNSESEYFEPSEPRSEWRKFCKLTDEFKACIRADEAASWLFAARYEEKADVEEAAK
jgi:hypothetical protein